MTDTVNVQRKELEKIDNFLRMTGVPLAHGVLVSINAMLAAPKADPVSDPYKLEAVKHLITTRLTLHDTDVTLGGVDRVAADIVAMLVPHPEAPKAEPFGHWVEHTIGEPVFIRNGSYVPKGENYTVTHLYTHPAPSSDELLEALGGGDVIALVDPERWDHPDAPQLAYAHGWNDAIAKHKDSLS